MPLIVYTFTPEGMDSVENSLDILAQLTYFGKQISPRLWELYPVLIDICVGTQQESSTKESVKAEGGWGFEFLKQMAVSFQNYIAKDPNAFIVGSSPSGTNLNLMFAFIARILEISKNKKAELDAVMGMKLLITMLEGLKVT
jgi:hypothetical protein